MSRKFHVVRFLKYEGICCAVAALAYLCTLTCLVLFQWTGINREPFTARKNVRKFSSNVTGKCLKLRRKAHTTSSPGPSPLSKWRTGKSKSRVSKKLGDFNYSKWRKGSRCRGNEPASRAENSGFSLPLRETDDKTSDEVILCIQFYFSFTSLLSWRFFFFDFKNVKEFYFTRINYCTTV